MQKAEEAHEAHEASALQDAASIQRDHHKIDGQEKEQGELEESQVEAPSEQATEPKAEQATPELQELPKEAATPCEDPPAEAPTRPADGPREAAPSTEVHEAEEVQKDAEEHMQAEGNTSKATAWTAQGEPVRLNGSNEVIAVGEKNATTGTEAAQEGEQESEGDHKGGQEAAVLAGTQIHGTEEREHGSEVKEASAKPDIGAPSARGEAGGAASTGEDLSNKKASKVSSCKLIPASLL